MAEFYDIEQNTDEWSQLRAGKITSSSLSKIMANEGKAFGDPAKAYAVSICIERITGMPLPSSYSNAHMERGHEQEPLARIAYEEEMFCEILNGGFFDSGDIGCSPDGLVYDEGLIEIKSVIHSVHFQNIKRSTFDPAYKWQLIGNLMLTNRDWIDFVSYCADFPEGRKLYVYRLWKASLADEFARLRNRVEMFRRLIDDTMKTIKESDYSITNKEHL